MGSTQKLKIVSEVRTTQPFDVLVFPCPRPMRDMACAGTIELPALWIRA